MSWKWTGGTLLRVPQGTSWMRSWDVFDSAGEPVDLSLVGFSAKAQLRARPSASAVLYTWSSDTANCDLTNDGRVILTLEPEETASWLFRRGVWDLEVTDPDGVVTRLDSGRLELLPEVTRP